MCHVAGNFDKVTHKLYLTFYQFIDYCLTIDPIRHRVGSIASRM